MIDDYKNSDNFQRMEGFKMITPHHFHPTNGVRPSDPNSKYGKTYGGGWKADAQTQFVRRRK